MIEKYWLFYLLALIAEIIGTISGFGSSILFIPIASLFFDFKIVLGITAIFHIFSNISKIYLFKNGIDKRIAIKMGIPAVISVIIGALLTNLLPQKELEIMMSTAIFIVAIYLLFNSSKKLADTNSNLIKGGLVSGFLAGLVGTGGAIRGLTLTAFGLEKNMFIATSALIDLGVDTSRAIVYTANGYVHKEFLITLPFLLVISLLGTWVGKIALKKIPQNWFKNIVLIIILLTCLIKLLIYLFHNV
ncbi:sulfite exporter TauE/SafE family protein [Pedobacter frigiditerrae]|uniref:sulfite exporter TauE/SafE family protein n=1 Tax=Pedobacter frigiditerrae TaxID=2530452 RepID=UPI00292DBD3B|nr:sulfite exporter TauE/SafE family protein [Pedobacter frigiditerrae]